MAIACRRDAQGQEWDQCEWEEGERRQPKVRRDEGDGGEDGVVLDLTLVGDGIFSAIYTVPVTVGSNNQTFQLQVDTGSSDLWIASKSCSTPACTANKPKLYDPSLSTSTNAEFQIQYLSGEVDGPIVWDSFGLGGYLIDSQALAAASNVVNESLASQYSGILGLALPLNSVIAQTIPPVTGDTPDGATVISNLFSTSPITQAPSQYFYSILLARPNMDRIPSVLGIGRHPSNDSLSDGLTIDPSQVTYSNPVSEANGVHYWKSELRGITVYVNGTAKVIDIGHSVTGSVFPEAVLDTGVPYIISSPSIANAVWGALGIGPANDGNYYLPCTMPLNMTITLDNREEIPIHPLDMSAVSTNGKLCTGLFQQSSTLSNSDGFGDIILGVPFLRNVYTVMAYEPASSEGIVGNGARRAKRATISPRLGLLNLTNPTTALDEFNTVRVLNEPLSGSNKQTSSSHGLSVGLEVLIGLLGFVALCGALFGGRWLYTRRQNKKMGSVSSEATNDKEEFAMAAYHLAPFRSHSFVPSEDTQRTLSDPTARLDKKYDSVHVKSGSFGDDELGFRRSKRIGDSDSEGQDEPEPERRARPRLGMEANERTDSWIDSYSEYQPPLLGEWRPPAHERSFSSSSIHSVHTPSSPLLKAVRPATAPMPLEREVDEFGGLDTSSLTGSGRRRGSSGDEDATLTNDSRRSPSRMSTASRPDTSPTRPISARMRPTRPPSGPRTSSMMSRVITADDIT